MLIQAGFRLGDFRVLGPLGRGGMGEVYRARDTRLRRDVALKVLPDAHVADPERLARFRRESVALASLSHPHIATLFGVEESGPVKALVMEVVEGETLAEYIARRSDTTHHRGLRLEDVLRFAAQIAEALECAHARGIVHRDLKPANIMVSPEGSIKVLDFGLVAMLAPPQAAVVTALTITVTGATGASMGTPAYMSPEQARGETVDRRTDMWAFGCVLYEMLTGRRAFEGESTLGILASVLEREPDLTKIPADTPPPLRRLLRRALAKDPGARLRDMADARLDILDAGRPPDAQVEPVTAPAVSAGWRRWIWTAAGASAGAILTATALWSVAGGRPSTAPVSRFAMSLSATGAFNPTGESRRNLAVSPDGSRVAFTSSTGLTIRRRDQFELESIDVGAPAAFPFFSPDGRWIGFGAAGTLKKVAVTGGAPIEIAKTTPGAATGAWGRGVIVFADASGLFAVADQGGTATKLAISLLPSEQVAFPEVLPDGEWVMFTVLPARTSTFGTLSQSPQSRVDAFNLRTGVQKTVLRGGGRPRVLAGGFLLFALNDKLYGTRFDLDAVEAVGDPALVNGDVGSSEFAISNEGTLAYVSGREGIERELIWVDRQGGEEPLGTPVREYVYPRISPDGTRVALDVGGPNRDIWVWNLARKVLERLTSDTSDDLLPVWSVDGRRLIFTSGRSGVQTVYAQASDGTGAAEKVVDTQRGQQAVTMAADGRLIVTEILPRGGRATWAMAMDGSAKRETLFEGLSGNASVSPDGRWIAYESNESGRPEVYVRPYRGSASGRVQVTSAGGGAPLWSRDSRELYYQDRALNMVVVPVNSTSVLTIGQPTRLFDGRRYRGGSGGRSYDLSHDGSRFLMIKTTNPPGITPITVAITENWFQELSARFSGQ